MELLTVIGIIALLIGILLPSLSRARDQAKRLKVRSTISAIDKGLEMFRNDFREYPDSDIGDDPIGDLMCGHTPDTRGMWGGQWLARAMVGHDGRGVDAQGLTVRSVTPDKTPLTVAQLDKVNRTGPYVEGVAAVPTSDPRFWHGAHGHTNDGPCSGRPALIDSVYASPILYYRANVHGTTPFCISDGSPQECKGKTGVYRLWDNFGFTGVSDDSGAWGIFDFAHTGVDIPAHPLGEFGSLVPSRINNPPPYYKSGRTFAGMLHDETALRAAGTVKPVNPETFILIDAGKDCLYGTDDDVTNFE